MFPATFFAELSFATNLNVFIFITWGFISSSKSGNFPLEGTTQTLEGRKILLSFYFFHTYQKYTECNSNPSIFNNNLNIAWHSGCEIRKTGCVCLFVNWMFLSFVMVLGDFRNNGIDEKISSSSGSFYLRRVLIQGLPQSVELGNLLNFPWYP